MFYGKDVGAISLPGFSRSGLGKRGAGDRIGPYTALIFDIRLEKVIG
jgi:hypothetical protein